MIALEETTPGGMALPATRGDVRRAPLPWGRWGLRASAILYLGLMIVLPLSAVAAHGLSDGLRAFWDDLTAPLALEALGLTIGAAIVMTLINAVMGTLTAYALVRYRFPGRGLLDGVIDLPFAIPTLVTGVMLVALYGPQTGVGSWLTAHGLPLIYAKPGIVLALLFVCYPFVVRTVQPVLHGAEKSQEEAAWTLGASGWTTFRRVVLPTIGPALHRSMRKNVGIDYFVPFCSFRVRSIIWMSSSLISVLSGGSVYSSSIQAPRSSILQRSEQNGRNSLP